MKEKILAAIKAKFPKVNLSKQRLDVIAAKIETKVDNDETKIDAAIDEFNDYNPLDELAKQDDTIRNLKSQVKPPAPAKKEESGEQNPPEKTDDDHTPEWAKQLSKSFEKLTADVAVLKGDKIQGSIRSKLDEKLKDVPSVFWEHRVLPENDEAIDTFIEKVNADYATFSQKQNNLGFSAIPTPAGGSDGGKKAVVDPAIKEFVEKQKAEAASS